MWRFSRTLLTLGAVLATVTAGSVFARSEDGGKTRQNLVRAVLSEQGHPAEGAPLLAAALRAHLLTGLEPLKDTPGVLLRTEGAPAFDYYFKDKTTLVVEMYDTLNGMNVSADGMPGGPVRRMSSRLSTLEPRFVSHVEIELAAPSHASLEPTAEGLRVLLAPPSVAKGAALQATTLMEALRRHGRRMAIESAGIVEQSHRLKDSHREREELAESRLGACTGRLAALKAVALEKRLHLAIPRDGDTMMTKVGGDGPTADPEVSSMMSATARLTTSVREAVGQISEAYKAACDEARHVTAQASQRLENDLDTCADILKRLENGDLQESQAREALALLEKKASRLEEEELTALWSVSERLDGAADAYGLALATVVESGSSQLAAMEATLARWRNDAAPKQDAPVVSVASVTSSGTAPALGKSVQPIASRPRQAVVERATNLATELEAVKNAQVRLDHAVMTPAATLTGNVGSIVFGQTANTTSAEPVVVEEEAPVVSETPTPTETPAEPAAQAPKEASAPSDVTVEPMAEPQKSVVVATPTVEAAEFMPSPTALTDPVNLDLREMELSNFVALLARKAGINVIAGTELTGTVTASIKNVPLMQAMEMVLRMHDLGIVKEEGVYRIIPYADAVAAERTTRMITLQNANVEDLKMTLDSMLMNAPDGKATTIASNASTNVLIIAGPPERVDELTSLVSALDVAKPVTPTVTEAIKLNYSQPDEMSVMVKGMLSKDVGTVATDVRGRRLIITDIPAVVEQIRKLVEDVDTPVKQVAIETMIVDAVLSDSSEIGTEWVLDLVRRRNTRGEVVGDLQSGSLTTSLGNVGTTDLNAGLLSFNVLTGDINIQAEIAAEAASRNAKILANPELVIVENEVGNISIVQEFPYQEITQTTQGPPVATTAFKPIGVTLEVEPRVTHNNEIIAHILAKESSVSGLTETGIPIEDKRQAETTLNVKDGQTIFIGGLRNHSNRLGINKVPVLGDVPVLNFLFRNTRAEKTNTELMIFLTCHVLGEHVPELTPGEQEAYDELGATPEVPDAQRAMFRAIKKPGEMRDPMWKWRRGK